MPNSQLQRFEDTKVQFIDGDRGVNYPSKSELSKNGDCLFLNTGNVTSTGFVFDSIDFISFEKDQKLRKGKAAHEDIIMTTRGTVGNVAFFDPTLPFEHIRINSGMVIVRTDKNEYLPYFLYLFFRSELFRKQCLTNGSGSAQPQLPISALKNISIPKLSTKTQQTIIDVIQKLDKKIELNNKINAELEAMAKLIYDYWFVQFDFPSDSPQNKGKPYKSSGGKMVYNDELKREIPDGWTVDIINNVIDVKDGTHDSPKSKESGYPLITSKHLKPEGLDFSSANLISEEDYININKRSQVDTGDILFSMIGSIGEIYKVDEETINFAIKNVALYKSSKKPEYMNFIYTYLKSYDMQRYMGNVTSGSIQKFIGLGALRNMPIFTNEDMITKFVKTTEHLFQKKTLIKLENQELTKLRDWLLPMLMNGQVTIK